MEAVSSKKELPTGTHAPESPTKGLHCKEAGDQQELLELLKSEIKKPEKVAWLLKGASYFAGLDDDQGTLGHDEWRLFQAYRESYLEAEKYYASDFPNWVSQRLGGAWMIYEVAAAATEVRPSFFEFHAAQLADLIF